MLQGLRKFYLVSFWTTDVEKLQIQVGRVYQTLVTAYSLARDMYEVP